MSELLDQEALEMHNPFQGPIPGQSLTKSPDESYPWEQPPKYTGVKEATEAVFLELLKPDNLEAVTDMMGNNVAIEDIANMLVFIGYTKGQFTQDLMLLLLEPIGYMLLAIAEQIGIEPVLYRDENQDQELDDEEDEDLTNIITSVESEIRNPKRLQDIQLKLNPNTVPQEIRERIENTDFTEIKESLLARKTQEETPETNQESLLERK